MMPRSTSLGKRKVTESTESVHRSKTPKLDGPVLIAHCPVYQSYFEQYDISTGVQYEIARLHSSGLLSYDRISLDSLQSLRGPSADAAPKVAHLFTPRPPGTDSRAYVQAFAKEIATRCPWKELDTEERFLKGDPFSALGGTSTTSYYGGKVHFRAKLTCTDPNPKSRSFPPDYKIILERAELGPSCRFFRRFGSTSFLKVKVHSSIINKSNNGLIDYFSNAFILNGRVYRAFYAKDDTVFMFRTNEGVDGYQVVPGTSGFSLFTFLNWHNPLVLNSKQSLTKWASRFALGLSTSVPALRFDVDSIHHEDDIVSSAGSDMTDGAGYINKIPLIEMQARFEWDSFPTAIQCRVGGSKGLLHLHPHPISALSPLPIAHLRPSQIKITYPLSATPDPSLLTLDLLTHSHLKSPGRLSHEITVNLAENNVHHHVFCDLFRIGLEAMSGGFMTWDDTCELWKYVAAKGGVFGARRAREAGAESRARGYGEKEFDDDDSDVDDEDGLVQAEKALHQRSAAWWWDELSGCPSSLEETVMVLLDAGFMVEECLVLRDKLKKMVEAAVDTYTRKCKIDIPMSCTAFIIPDPYGVLGEREVHIKSGRRNFKNVDKTETDLIIGDVLLARHPCKLPSDVQKFQAVEKPELRHLTDVIVCSTRGSRRQADLLSGGDYDGDKVLAIWQPEIVGPFVNADDKYAKEPEDVSECFDCERGTVEEFLARDVASADREGIKVLQKALLGALGDPGVVGWYSTFHLNAIYRYGYEHEDTVRLAYKFCKVLDGAKTGLSIKSSVYKQDRDQWQRNLPPEWKKHTEGKKDQNPYADPDNRTSLKRLPGLPRFVMDSVSDFARVENTRQKGLFRDRFKECDEEQQQRHRLQQKVTIPDADLVEPWLEAKRLAERFVEEEGSDRMMRDLVKIEEHVQLVHKHHREQVSSSPSSVQFSPSKKSSDKKSNRNGAPFSELPIQVRQDMIRALSDEFGSRPRPFEDVLMDEAMVRRVRASYAYWYDYDVLGRSHYGEMERKVKVTKRWTRFPWDVAMRELCAIKAQAKGPCKTVTAEFYQRFSLK